MNEQEEAIPKEADEEDISSSVHPLIIMESLNEDSNLGSEISEPPVLDPPEPSTTAEKAEENSENSSSAESTSTPLARKPSVSRNRGARAFACSQSDMYGEILAENVHEYEWPPKSGARYFLQEQGIIPKLRQMLKHHLSKFSSRKEYHPQVMEYLGVKSFKRKYPQLTRRPVGTEEREYIKEKGIVGETQADLGLIALINTEVLDIMSNEYPELYEGYQKALAERTKELLAAKQREMESLKSDSKKLKELRKRAMQAASEWNSDFNRDRKRERKDGFWDLQTMTIQVGKKSSVKQGLDTNPGAYPVAVMTGQFQNHYKKYTPEELNKLPLSTVTECGDYIPVRRVASPPPITVDESELKPDTPEPVETVEPASAEAGETSQDKYPDLNNEKDSLSADKGESSVGEVRERPCAVCRECVSGPGSGARYLVCSECGSVGHPKCLDMTEEMYVTARGYDWKCMECKPCSVCKNLDGEDKMMFCDKCDRGYHTYCVGLGALPTGRWVCEKYCGGRASLPGTAPSSAAGSGRSTPATPVGEQKKCTECDVVITKANKLHHRSKYWKEGICVDCAASRG